MLAFLGHGQPYSGLLANLFAIPWVSIVVMPVLIAGSALLWLFPACQSWVLLIFDGVLEVLWQVLNWLASLDVPVSNPGIGVAGGMSLLMLTALVLPSHRVRWVVGLAVSLLLGGASVADRSPNPWLESVEIRVWDSTSEMRYFVLPEAPSNFQNKSLDELESMVTRNSMIGVEKIKDPEIR